MGLLQTAGQLIWHRKKKVEQMAKKKKEPVRFTVTDGVKPTRHGPGQVFNLCSPINLNIKANATVKVNLGLRCNYPLHAFEALSMKQRGIKLPDGLWAAADAGTELIVDLRNESKDTQLVERGDAIARAFVLDNNDLEVEE